jgi:CheY-like chemotaxis protein
MLRVLLIEDDISFQFALRKLLQCFGYVVTAVDNGKDGLIQYQKNPAIDIILCDIDIPLLDGFQFLQRLRKITDKIPAFAFISAYVDMNIIQGTYKLGADCVIKKPIDHEVLRIILFALEKKHNLQSQPRLSCSG